MVLIKTLLTGLIGFSLCLANISGIVTDTGKTPIPGASVWLHTSGQAATSGSDGRFTIIVSTAIVSQNGKLFPSGLSALISGNLMNVTIVERAAVEVSTFDLTGKALSTVRKTMDAGCHSIALPYRGAGVYLYKVKSGNREFVLKGNTVGCIPSGSSVTTQGSSSNHLAKQAQITAAIDDVLTVTKTGYLNYRCAQYNSDTSGIVIQMIKSAGTLTDVDGKEYQTVQIGNQVWMTENLRVTKYNDRTEIPFDTATATWIYATTPKYCYYNNTTNSATIRKYGALYNWYVVNPQNPKKIAPAGWHVPTDADWDTLETYLGYKGYNWDGTLTGNKIGKSLAAKTDWFSYSTKGTVGCDLSMNNRSGFTALPGGMRNNFGLFNRQDSLGYFWSATEYDALKANYRYLNFSVDNILRLKLSKGMGYSVRLVKD